MDASRPRSRERFAGRSPVGAGARHDRDRRRVSVHVRPDRRLRSQGHAHRVRTTRAEAGLTFREGKAMSANRELLERYVELYNQGDLDACIGLYADDAVQRWPDGLFE